MKLYKSRDWLYKRRIIDRKTVEEMAEEAKVKPMSIRRALAEHGIK